MKGSLVSFHHSPHFSPLEFISSIQPLQTSRIKSQLLAHPRIGNAHASDIGVLDIKVYSVKVGLSGGTAGEMHPVAWVIDGITTMLMPATAR